jgi:CPA1 family monovalent cation:H+ antiporter
LLVGFAPLIIAAFLAIVAARIISVYPIVTLTSFIGERIPNSYKKILAVAGLRGVISVALALSLPDDFPFREAIVAMTFGVALLSLVAQGEFIQFYVKTSKKWK